MKDIIDLQIINNNFIQVKEIQFNIEDIEKCIAKIKYNGQGLIKDNKVEYAKLPSIAKIFYMFIYNRIIPTPERLFMAYYNTYFSTIDCNKCNCIINNEIYSIEGVKARVLRTYPSLLRDFHFFVLCYNSKYFDKVKYSFSDDVKKGIDLTVVYKNKEYGVSLFVETPRSKKYKKQKYKRHDYSFIKEICIPINPFDKNNYIGDFALYNKTHVQYLLYSIVHDTSLDNITNVPLKVI